MDGEASRSPSAETAAEALHGYTADPFDGLFTSGTVDDVIAPGSLIDVPAARRWFDIFVTGFPDGLYTYQLPLGRAAGPVSEALGGEFVMFSSYSYLGLIGHPRLATAVKEAVERYGTSTGGVRLMTGTLALHHELEDELARFLRQPAAAVFPSGYDANIAAISSLFGPGDVAILDQFAHQSIHDGARMAGCELRRFRHNDMGALEQRLRQARNRGVRRILVAVDAVFSMDGDQAPLADILTLREKYGFFILVDEAHSIGAIGETGRGICEARSIDPAAIDLLTGSLSKAIPSSGGFVAGSKALKVFLQHGSAPYMFSAAISPANAAAILESLRILRDEPGRMQRLRENTARLKHGLQALGFDTSRSASPVVPLILGEEWRAIRWARDALRAGVFVSAVTYPAVSAGHARLRLCATAAHEPEHFDRLFAALEHCLELEAVPADASS